MKVCEALVKGGADASAQREFRKIVAESEKLARLTEVMKGQ